MLNNNNKYEWFNPLIKEWIKIKSDYFFLIYMNH